MPSFSISLPRPVLETEDKPHWMKEATRASHSCRERRGTGQGSWVGLTLVPRHFLEKMAESRPSLFGKAFQKLDHRISVLLTERWASLYCIRFHLLPCRSPGETEGVWAGEAGLVKTAAGMGTAASSCSMPGRNGLSELNLKNKNTASLHISFH